MPDNEESQDGSPDEGESKAEAKPVTQKDLDALKSTYDAKLAEQGKTIKSLSQSRADLEIQLAEAREVIDSASKHVVVDDDTPADEVNKKIGALEAERNEARRMAIGSFNAWTGVAAEAAAYRLAVEHDAADEVESLKEKFAEAAKKGQESLQNAVEKAEIALERAKLTKEKEKPKSERREQNYDENVARGRAPTRVVDKIKAIDMYSPDGLKTWEQQRRDLAKQAGVPLP